MVKIISVKFRGNCRSYYFDPGEYDIRTGDGMIVETARGEEYGDVVEGVKEIEDTLVPQALKPVIRPATEEDARLRQEFINKESDAFMLCQERIADHKLDMKLVDVEYTYNGSKIVFYFTADERVDFRDLVKDLAYALRTRIELRQIGVRDEAKMLGGLGPCGRPVCCKAFLDDFRPVSIKMAKEQNLSLSPTKISGLCGRLMCCLQYEQYAYEEAHKRLPRVGKELETPDGVGIVTECNVLTERVKVRLTEEDGSFEIREFACTDVGPGTLGKKPEPKKEEPEDAAPDAPAFDEPDKATDKAPAKAPEKSAKAPEKPARPADKKPERNEQRDRHSRHDRSRREKNAAEGAGEAKQAAPGRENAQKNGEERKDKKPEPAQNRTEQRGEKGAEAEGTPKRENSRRRHRGRGNGEKPASQGNAPTEKRERPANTEKRDKPAEKRDKPAEKRDKPAEKREITRLPGETIGLGKQEQPAEAPKAAAPSHRSNLHRKHSFGPRS